MIMAEVRQHLRCFIRGTVIYNDDFERAIILLKEAFEAGNDVLRAIVNTNDDGGE